MAKLIPNEPTGQVSPAVARMFRLVRSLPHAFTAWFSMNTGEAPRPHFLMVWQERYAFLLQVAETSQPLAESALQRDFLTETETTITADTLGHDEAECLASFAKQLGEDLGLGPHTKVPVKRLVVFPNVAEHTIDQIVVQRSQDTGTRFLGCHQLGETAFATRLEEMAEEALPPPTLEVFRKRFNPETVLPDEFSPLRPPDRNTRAQLTTSLLDFDQEAIAKADLSLPAEAEGLVHDLKARLVTGVAGSGKSLILLIRTLLMQRLHDNARMLVLTHNRPLNGELRRRFHRLTGHWPAFEWMTFFQWVRRCLPPEDWPERILSGQSLESLVKQTVQHHRPLHDLSLPFLIDELHWIKDQRLVTQEAYLQASRQGRGLPLSAPLRAAMWAFFRDYQLALKRDHASDWSGVAMRFWKRAIEERQLALPLYDAVFVDEAQFFAPAWFDCIKAAVRPGGQLFLCADPTQGFLRRRQSWLASGIEVRGRTVRLEHSYRNSPSILTFATRFYRARLGEEAPDEAINLPAPSPAPPSLSPAHEPQVERCGSPQDCLTRLVNEIRALAKGDLRPGSLLVLHRHFPALEEIHRRLSKHLGEKASQILQDLSRPDSQTPVGLSTLNAGTGLEAPIVFVLGLDELLEAEEDPQLSADEKQGLVRDHTRQIYMAMTRAAQRLVILCHRANTVTALTPTDTDEGHRASHPQP